MRISTRKATSETIKELEARLHEIERTAVRPEGVNWEQFIAYMILQGESLETNASSPEYNTAMETLGIKHPELIEEE